MIIFEYFSTMRAVFIFVVCCVCSYALHAQSSKKAERHYRKALEYKSVRKMDKACHQMELAIKEQPDFSEAYSLLGEWYFKLHHFYQAEITFANAYAKCPNGAKAFAHPLALSLLYSMSPDSALLVLSSYAPAKETKEWEQMRNQAFFMKRELNKVITDTPVNMGPRINTPDPELFPWITADSQTFYLTCRVNNMDEDFFYATPDSCGGWFTARNLGPAFNTPNQENSLSISADGHYLFFTRCDNRSDNGWAQGGCDLYMAFRASPDSVWSTPQSFGATINTSDYEGQASLSPDNRELYFVSNRPGGYGGYDIWVSRFEDGLWQQPRNLGPEINTAGDETAPFIAIDNKTLYFTSDGHTGMGGSDLFITHRRQDTLWSEAVNMGYPINTTGDEKSVSITQDGKTMYFASDRDSVAGNFDIYRITLPASLRPQPVSSITGYVYDSLTKEPLNYAGILIYNAATGTELYHFESNRGDGSFMVTLPAGYYKYKAARIGYTDIEDTFIIAKDSVMAPSGRSIAMLPDDYARPIKDSLIATVHFDPNKAALTDSDRMLIRNAAGPWLLEKGIVVMVNGYADNTGTPIINEQLSYERAGLVTKELAADGFDEMSVRSQGYGEANAIATNDTEEGRRQNRRVEIIIRR